MRARSAAGRLLVAASLASSGWLAGPPPVGAASPLAAAQAYLARTLGGSPSSWRLVYERPLPGDIGTWVGKLVSASSGDVRVVYRRADGTLGEQAAPPAAEGTSAAVKFASKADDALRSAVAAAGPAARLPVAVWLEADPAAAVATVVARHPEVPWIGDRPAVGDLPTLRALRAELDAARRGVYGAVQAAYRRRIEALGGAVAYESTATPLVFADVPAGSIAAIAADPGVTGLGLEQAWAPSMATAGPAVQADWTGGSGDQGTGVRIAVVEYHNVRPGGDLTGHVVASHSTTGTLAYTGGGTFDHPTWVAGAVASQNGTWRGVAPGAVIVSSGTGGYSPSIASDRAIIAAADWAISAAGGDADIVNTSLVQDTATGAAEARRYFDAIAYESGRLPVSAAGNFVNFNNWTVGSPGTAWNVLTVGGIDDRGTLATSDDRVWYVPGSNGANYADPPGTAWNADGDFNKPDVAAPAVGVRTANGLAASGTSVATPIVAGIAAQLMARSPTLAAWPEAIRAIVIAGAVRHTVMPDGSVNADHEGAGTVNALWANRIIGQGDSPYGGMTFGTMSAGTRPAVSIEVTAGQRVRVALAWSSHTSGAMLTKADTADGRPRPARHPPRRRDPWLVHARQRERVGRVRGTGERDRADRGARHAVRRHRRAIWAGVGEDLAADPGRALRRSGPLRDRRRHLGGERHPGRRHRLCRHRRRLPGRPRGRARRRGRERVRAPRPTRRHPDHHRGRAPTPGAGEDRHRRRPERGERASRSSAARVRGQRRAGRGGGPICDRRRDLRGPLRAGCAGRVRRHRRKLSRRAVRWGGRRHARRPDAADPPRRPAGRDRR